MSDLYCRPPGKKYQDDRLGLGVDFVIVLAPGIGVPRCLVHGHDALDQRAAIDLPERSGGRIDEHGKQSKGHGVQPLNRLATCLTKWRRLSRSDRKYRANSMKMPPRMSQCCRWRWTAFPTPSFHVKRPSSGRAVGGFL
jgi:hypothetical protein